MNIRQMEVLHAIVRAGSATGAAKLLNVTQPAISSILRHCEDQLRIKLFDRSGGRLTPTPEARAIFPDIDNIFQRVETVGRMAIDLANGRLGKINIAAILPIANGPLPQVIAQFAAKNPLVDFSVQGLPTYQVVQRVARREADIGLGFAPISDPAVATEVIAHGELCCVMSQSHPHAAQTEVTVEQLAGQPIITYGSHTPVGAAVEAMFAKAAVPLTRGPTVNQSISAIKLSRYGLGISIVEPMLEMSLLNDLKVRRLRPAPSIDTVLILPSDSYETRTVRKFIEEIKGVMHTSSLIE